ncbi:MAG: hypothetical protein JST93_12965 [Acidobacteria bacterium]|nr:hypothetical protein [Acidobacteriota bacterium]
MNDTELDDRLRTAGTLVRRVVAFRLRHDSFAQDREDVQAEALVDLIRRLQDPAANVEDWNAYVSVVAHHACDRYFRARFPQRHRLKNRIRYLADQDRRFAIWSGPDGQLVFGWNHFHGQQPVTISNVLLKPGPLETVCAALLQGSAGPVPLDDLVDQVANCLGIRDVHISLDTVPPPVTSTQDRDRKIDQERWLARLWMEILQLPLAQRVALLLHLRDERGGPALPNLPASGAATLRQIATAMEMPADELAAIWASLPWNDLKIAERLQITRQQVINLRAAARQRLARRCPPTPS